MYFLGLHWMHTFKSGLFSGAGSDAEYLALHMDLATERRPASRSGSGWHPVSAQMSWGGSALTEGEGFEPSSEENPLKRFSRPPHSTALPPLLGDRKG